MIIVKPDSRSLASHSRADEREGGADVLIRSPFRQCFRAISP
ncbi:hypothetical protein CZ774_14405 [Frigoribacterium sp. JB110]|nr:hypothetical protein CZ774_14405 [Frigoribacterium sp. JB110]